MIEMSVPPQLSYFKLQEEIGRGGMGSVWRALDPTLNREVAIKVLRDEIARDPKFVADFLQEARNAAAISHPHIVQVHLVGDYGGQYYIVMELLRGRSLREILDKDGQLDEERALDIAIEVADALRAAYTQKMIHGDIKPANIFITEDQGAKVLDFGLAKLANVDVPPSESGIWGSPYYISPERVGQKAEDFRSDVYSLGASLFHALTGRPPFDAEDPAQLALKRLNEKPPLLCDLNPKITAKTEQVVNKMLNKSIMMRYLDYDALLKDLHEAKTEATAQRLGVDLHAMEHLPPTVPVRPPSPPLPQNLPIIIGVTVAAVAIIVAVGFVLWHGHATQNPPIVQPPPVHKPPPPPPPPPPPKRPVTPTRPAVEACWLLNGRGDDVSGNGHTLSFVGNPTFVQGHAGLALSLNGVGQYAQTKEKVVDISKPFSVTAWVTWNGGSSNSPMFISQDAPESSAFYLGKGETKGFTFALKRATLQVSKVESPTALLANTWYHVVGVFTGNKIKLYVDGTLVRADTVPTIYSAGGPMIVGAGLSDDKRSNYWDGLINEVKVFNRAIADDEVASIAAVRPAVVKSSHASSTAATNTVPGAAATAARTNTTSSVTSTNVVRSSADEEKSVQTVVASLADLWLAYDFPTALARCNDLNQQLTTPQGKQAIRVHLAIARHLADFKAQLIADFQRQPYNAVNLVTRNNAPLSGWVNNATDRELLVGTQYGDLGTPWADLRPESLVKAGEFYADHVNPSEPAGIQAKRHFQLMVFCKQFNLDCPGRKHAVEANRLDPGLREETILIWGSIPTPCATQEKHGTATTPQSSKPKQSKSK
ncbi:MAG: protein kinase [Verrucomicrobiia bacterium]